MHENNGTYFFPTPYTPSINTTITRTCRKSEIRIQINIKKRRQKRLVRSNCDFGENGLGKTASPVTRYLPSFWQVKRR
jgi:hypothetical protein